MDGLVKDIEKVGKRQKILKAETDSNLNSLISTLEACKNNLSGPEVHDLAATAKHNATKLSEAYKDAQGTLHKYIRTVEKKFKVDLDAVWDPKAFVGKDEALNVAIAQHFVREGRFDVAEAFIKESGTVISEEFKAQFQEIFLIQKSLRSRSLDLAIDWASRHHHELSSKNSTLEFQLHRLVFIQLLIQKNRKGALDYAKAHFGRFAARHLTDIKKLMGSLVYINRLASSPYASFQDAISWTDIQSQFSRDFCMLLGLSSDSPLYIAMSVGTTALPTIIKMSSIMKDKSGLEWTNQGELPVEIPLPDSRRFHSVFACPVSKEQSTEENPPMMISCGHVISKESLSRVSKGNANMRFKCPYCPVESTSAQAIRVYF